MYERLRYGLAQCGNPELDDIRNVVEGLIKYERGALTGRGRELGTNHQFRPLEWVLSDPLYMSDTSTRPDYGGNHSVIVSALICTVLKKNETDHKYL